MLASVGRDADGRRHDCLSSVSVQSVRFLCSCYAHFFTCASLNTTSKHDALPNKPLKTRLIASPAWIGGLACWEKLCKQRCYVDQAFVPEELATGPMNPSALL